METDNNWSEAKDHFEQYVTVQLKLLKLNLVEKSTGVAAALFSSLVVYLLLLLAVIFLSIAGAIVINEYTHSAYWGYFAVAGFYFLVYIILRLSRKVFLKKIIMNGMIKKIYEDD